MAGISYLVFLIGITLIGIPLSTGKIQTINVNHSDLEPGKLFILIVHHCLNSISISVDSTTFL